jgi:hypothetical protein
MDRISKTKIAIVAGFCLWVALLNSVYVTHCNNRGKLDFISEAIAGMHTEMETLLDKVWAIEFTSEFKNSDDKL